jgi:hypothetical protein
MVVEVPTYETLVRSTAMEKHELSEIDFELGNDRDANAQP